MSKIFQRKMNNTCNFLVLQNCCSIFIDADDAGEEDEINKKWSDKKHFLSSSLEGMVLVSLIDFECKKTIILDQELYNKFEIEMGVEPNTFIDYEFTTNGCVKIADTADTADTDDTAETVNATDNWWQFDDPQFEMLYVFAYMDGRIFDYTHQDFCTHMHMNKSTSLIRNILNALDNVCLDSPRGYCLNDKSERYNNCIIFDFDYI